ncbi:hypothetical protein LJC02_03495, partial [Breznakia sp. OttesenSCG-928-G09]|nr:hypothetical protein [Breznakia sp. OttesenSCG-928-G09]
NAFYGSNPKIFFIYFIIACTGILFWLRIAKILEPITKKSKTIITIASNTLYIMIHQCFVTFIINLSLFKIFQVASFTTSFDVNAFKTNMLYVYDPFQNGRTAIIYIVLGLLIPILLKKIIMYGKEKVSKSRLYSMLNL